jgi:hypothetical protein
VGADRLLALLGRYRLLALAGILLLSPLDLAARGGYHSVSTSWWSTPPGYPELGELPGEALLELPLAPPLVRTEIPLSYQRVHGKRLVGGHAIWVDHVRPDAWDAWVQGHSFLTALMDLELGRSQGRFSFNPADPPSLAAEGLRLLALNPEYLMESAAKLEKIYRGVFEVLFGEPVLRVGGLTVWDLTRYTGIHTLEVPVFEPDPEDLCQDGIRTGRARVVVSSAWRPLERKFPPEVPPKDEHLESLKSLPPMIRNRVLRDAGVAPR